MNCIRMQLARHTQPTPLPCADYLAQLRRAISPLYHSKALLGKLRAEEKYGDEANEMKRILEDRSTLESIGGILRRGGWVGREGRPRSGFGQLRGM